MNKINLVQFFCIIHVIFFKIEMHYFCSVQFPELLFVLAVLMRHYPYHAAPGENNFIGEGIFFFSSCMFVFHFLCVRVCEYQLSTFEFFIIFTVVITFAVILKYVLFALHRSHWCDNILWCCSIQTLNTCSTRWVSCHCLYDTCFTAVFQPIHNIDMILKPSLFFISNFTQVPMPLLFLQQGALMFQLETSRLKTLCSTTAAEYHDKGGLF